MAKKITQKELKHDEFVDAAFDFGHWLEQHWKTVAQLLVAGLVLVVAIVLWVAWSARSLKENRQELAASIALYATLEAGGFADSAGLQAVHGRFAAVADKLDGDESGLLADFYLAATDFRLGRHDEARTTLASIVEAAPATETLGATARLMLARVEIASGDEDAAIAVLEGLAGNADAAVPPDQALMEVARIHEAAGRGEAARAQWQRIVDEFPQSPSAVEARTLLQ